MTLQPQSTCCSPPWAPSLASIRWRHGNPGRLGSSDDEEIAEAADEAIAMAERAADEADYEEDASEWIN
jgi:hypothetical protein